MDQRLLLKSFISGLAGGLIFYLCIQWLLSSGYAPFNVGPIAALLLKIGIPPTPWAAIVVLLVGGAMSSLLTLLYGDNINTGHGISLGISLWLLMMLAVSPMVEWGVFGVGDANFLDKGEIFYLKSGWKYPLVMLGFHLVYGLIVGFLDAKWAVGHIDEEEE